MVALIFEALLPALGEIFVYMFIELFLYTFCYSLGYGFLKVITLGRYPKRYIPGKPTKFGDVEGLVALGFLLVLLVVWVWVW